MKFFSKHFKPFFLLLFLLIPLLFINKSDFVVFINSTRNPFFDSFFKVITHLGDGLLLLPLVVFVLRYKLKWLAIFIVAFLFHVVLVHLFKQGIMNDAFRPYSFFEAQNKLHLLNFIDGVTIRKFNTFPSGHTATAFFIASFFALKLKNKTKTAFLLFLALLVGFSRIYLLQHFYIDVYFGMFFGIISTAIAHKVIKKNPKTWHRQKVVIHFTEKKIPQIQTQRAV